MLINYFSQRFSFEIFENGSNFVFCAKEMCISLSPLIVSEKYCAREPVGLSCNLSELPCSLVHCVKVFMWYFNKYHKTCLRSWYTVELAHRGCAFIFLVHRCETHKILYAQHSTTIRALQSINYEMLQYKTQRKCTTKRFICTS